MENGNTTANISPVQQEPDMNAVRAIFDKALNAMVDATSLAKEVESLRQSVQGLTRDVEQMRASNKWLDEQIQMLRGERDTLKNQNSQQVSTIQHLEQQNDSLLHQLHAAEHVVNVRGEEVQKLVKERDEAQYSLLQAQDEIAKYREAYEKLSAVLTPLAQPKVVNEPMPEAAKPFEGHNLDQGVQHGEGFHHF